MHHSPTDLDAPRRSRRGRRRTLATLGTAAVALGLLAAACGSDKNSSGAATTTGGATTTAASGGAATTGASGATTSGPAKQADPSLSKIKIGLINQEAGASGAFPEIAAANKAAVEYINQQLGGVAGHAIEIDKCVADGTVASSQKCAQQMVSDNVLYVTGGLDNNMQAWYPILGPAKIPVVGGIPVAGADFTAANSFMFIGGGAVAYPGLAAYTLKYLPNAKNVGILANDTPGAAAALPLVQKPLEAAGVKVTDLKVPATQADWLAPFASLKDMDAIMVLISPPNCISVAKARDSQQSQVPMVSVSSCYSKAVLDGAGTNGLNGWTVNQYFDDPQGTTPDAVTYQTVMKQYAGADANLSGFAPVAFSNMMTAYNNVLTTLGPDATSDKISTQMADPAGGQVFMGPKYVCGATDNPYSAICNYNLQWFAISAGKLTNPTGVRGHPPDDQGRPELTRLLA